MLNEMIQIFKDHWKGHKYVYALSAALIVFGLISKAYAEDHSTTAEILEISCDDAKIVGFYHPVTNHLTMCITEDHPLYLETFTHELVHKIQDCMVGLDNGYMDTIYEFDVIVANITMETRNMLRFAYGLQEGDLRWYIEAEAFMLEHNPELVLSLFERICNA